jgi:hypothetical protein
MKLISHSFYFLQICYKFYMFSKICKDNAAIIPITELLNRKTFHPPPQLSNVAMLWFHYNFIPRFLNFDDCETYLGSLHVILQLN